jgi:two-component system NtrC family sensor kinase
MSGGIDPGISDEQLVEMQRQATLGRLLAGVVHEISAPAGTILANCDTELRLLDRIEQALAGQQAGRAKELVESCRELARVDQAAGERIHRLVRSLKVAARATALEPQTAGVNEIVDSVLQLARAQFRSRLTMENDFGALPEVECYPHLLSQAILNLVTNAAQAIEGEGRITAGTRLEGDTVHIWIQDTGPGIRPEDRDKILQRGFTTKPVGIGTGLGLSIVKRVVTQDHRGTVWFESDWGHGATFHIRIPLKQKEPGQSA